MGRGFCPARGRRDKVNLPPAAAFEPARGQQRLDVSPAGVDPPGPPGGR